MNIVNTRESIIELTRLNPFERFPDGRPRVSDDLLERMKLVTTEEAWGVMRKEGYPLQFEGDWFCTHPGKILVGRAVTAMMVPRRPDFNELVEETGKKEGRVGGQNSWVIDTLVTGDVMVVDLFGKIKDGTFVGDNLSTSLQAHTKAGAVIEGGIRDFQGVSELTELAIFCRGIHPTAIADTTLAGINIPIRIGETTVLPGDVVLGTPTGVTFIPPHLVQRVVEQSEDIRLRDQFGKQRLKEGRYTPGEIDRKWTAEIESDFKEWLKTTSVTAN
ncbi:RraA family protein [Candidatus Bathyarchaeota archaeon]|nr:MAG: RraA family protein [Candidatus Bathyarchaeota archaeon]